MRLRNLIVFIMVLCVFAGCGTDNNTSSGENQAGEINSSNALERYNSAVDALFNSDSYTITGNTDISMTEEGKESFNMGMTMSSELKAGKDENGNRTASLETFFELADMTEKGGGYYKDGYFYPQSIKQKMKTDYEGIFSEGNINIFKLTDNVLSQGAEPVIKKVENGYRIDFDLNVDVLKQEVPDFLSNLLDYLRVSEHDFTMLECQVVAIIGDNGELRAGTLVSKAQVELYDGTSEADFRDFKVDCDIEITESISQINNTEVTFPDNLDEYVDVTPKTDSEETSE